MAFRKRVGDALTREGKCHRLVRVIGLSVSQNFCCLKFGANFVQKNCGFFFSSGNDTGEGILKVLEDFAENFAEEERVSGGVFVVLLALYCVVILIGVTGNVIILSAILSKPKMRTARNIFIVTLSGSDLVLCVIAMPLTLWDVLR